MGAVRAQAGEGGGGGALGDVIVWAITESLKVLFSPLEGIIQNHANDVLTVIIGTPHPNAVFTEPTNNSWPGIYTYFWDVIVPLSLLLWALAAGIVIFLESTSYLFSSYHRAKLKRRAFAGLLGILAWWWMDALARQFIHELTLFLAPDLSEITLFETLSFGAVGSVTAIAALSVDLFLLGLVLLIYFVREVVLYLFTLLVPILIAFWIPGVGPFRLVSEFMKRLAGFYVPFLFMTVPVALLFRLGEILGNSFGFTVEGLGAWLVALIIPIVAVVSPFILFWQAGSIFFMAQSASHHSSRRRAHGRIAGAQEKGQIASHGGRNFVRGVRGQQAVNADGQAVFNSGNSRAHAAGSRLNTTGSRLRGTFAREHTAEAETNTSASGSDSVRSSSDRSSESRNQRFDTLRDRTDSRNKQKRESRDSGAVDDDPRYIQ
ncbi:hypothetical protein HZS55_06400 [Halosimplex rubrum]|uniref:Uncharacterized protein n=1 Tax=Halosimplex rubrum TaxID=869889 RepID=A0A7D5TEZ8_9EURY|nr:hypothetical protein HZS55_06400 [Halosimplex rubrum]